MLKRWLLAGNIRVNGENAAASMRVKGNESIQFDAVVACDPGLDAPAAENIPLGILYQDEDLIIVNKPIGLVVHPAAGHRGGTLLNGLLHHQPSLVELPRCGIVHRLDKDTSGVMVVAASDLGHTRLVAQLQCRSMHREYQAVVQGTLIAGATVDAPIDRHPMDRKRMGVVIGGRRAVTHYRIAGRYRAHTRLQVRLETGRTHQIRVHMAHLRHPIVGDRTYGGRPTFPRGASAELIGILRAFPHQALHARRLTLQHPRSGATMNFQAPMPDDFAALCAALREDARDHGLD